MQGQSNKAESLKALCNKLNITPDEAVCFGDDLNDMPMFRIAGFVACPKDAHPFVKNYADYVTTLEGGKGALRELCDLILIAKNVLNADGGYIDERY